MSFVREKTRFNFNSSSSKKKLMKLMRGSNKSQTFPFESLERYHRLSLSLLFYFTTHEKLSIHSNTNTKRSRNSALIKGLKHFVSLLCGLFTCSSFLILLSTFSYHLYRSLHHPTRPRLRMHSRLKRLSSGSWHWIQGTCGHTHGIMARSRDSELTKFSSPRETSSYVIVSRSRATMCFRARRKPLRRYILWSIRWANLGLHESLIWDRLCC